MTKTLRLIELFAGYGSQALAIKRLNIPFEHYRVIEFDKYAIKSYNAVHGTDFAPTDICNVIGDDLGIVDTDKYNYLLTYSFPCTDLSKAGKVKGMSKGSNTRSGLLWEVERILKELKTLPQFLVMENVPQVHSDANINDFADWITFLDSLGYTSKWQDLNAKDFGIPQNRERCFMVSYLDNSLQYAFPESIPLTSTAQEYLEDNVAEKYYIKTEKAKELIEKLIIENGLDSVIYVKDNTEKGYKELDTGGIVNLYYPESLTKRGRVQTRPRVCPTIAVDGILMQMTKERLVVDRSTTKTKILNTAQTIKTAQRGIEKRTGKETGVLEITGKGANKLAYLNYDHIEDTNKTIAKTLCCRDYKGFGTGFNTMNGVIDSVIEYRIRKLTPLECFRLMDVSDEDAKKMLSVNSESQCYKQAGNSIVVAVLEKIFYNIFCGGSSKVSRQLDIFDIL